MEEEMRQTFLAQNTTFDVFSRGTVQKKDHAFFEKKQAKKLLTNNFHKWYWQTFLIDSRVQRQLPHE